MDVHGMKIESTKGTIVADPDYLDDFANFCGPDICGWIVAAVLDCKCVVWTFAVFEDVDEVWCR